MQSYNSGSAIGITPVLSSNIINKIYNLGIGTANIIRPYVDYDNDTIYLLTDDGEKIRKSTDGGNTFSIVKTFSNVRVREMLRLSDGYFLLWSGGTGKVILVDSNFATVSSITVSAITTLNVGNSIDYKPAEGIVMYADYNETAAGQRVYRSIDNGRTFTEVLNDPTVRHFHSCQVDPYTGDWYVVSGDTQAETKIYKSVDDGDNWTIVAENNLILKAIRLVFTRDKIMWATDEIEGDARVVSTARTPFNPVSIGTVGGAVLANRTTANGLCLFGFRCETNSTEKDVGRMFLTDGVTVKEIFSSAAKTPTATGAYGYSNISHVDRYNRVWVYADEIGLINISVPFVIS